MKAHAFETAKFDGIAERSGIAERRDTTTTRILELDDPTVEQADQFAKANYSTYSEAHADLEEGKASFDAALETMSEENAASYEQDDRGIEGGERVRAHNAAELGKRAVELMEITTFATMNANEALDQGREFYAQHKDTLHEAAIKDARAHGVSLNL